MGLTRASRASCLGVLPTTVLGRTAASSSLDDPPVFVEKSALKNL